MARRSKIYRRAVEKKPRSLERAQQNPVEKNVVRALRNILIAAASETGYQKLSESAAEYLAEEAWELMQRKGLEVPKAVTAADDQAPAFLETVTKELEGSPAYINYVRELKTEQKFCGVDPWC